jgi:uncharacterized protein YdhG (YjbR/CyaY superfamily)
MKTTADGASLIDDYIKPFAEDTRKLLDQMRSTIQKTAPEATEKMSYGMPTFYFNGNLVHFAAFKNHIGFFPTPSAIEKFQKELESYKTSKGTVQFPLTGPLPVKLIERMVKFRVRENAAKSAHKS